MKGFCNYRAGMLKVDGAIGKPVTHIFHNLKYIPCKSLANVIFLYPITNARHFNKR